jgi:hypothetical protein
VSDLTKVGLVYADEQSIHTELQTRLAINRDFEIPPGDGNFEVEMMSGPFPPGSELWAIAPHMHYRGKSFRVVADTEKDSKTLLSVPNYDFNWQHAYVLADRLPLQGVTIRCSATFDNSEKNLVNPDPTATVRWGDQTWEEMAMGYLAIMVPRKSEASKAGQRPGIVSSSGKALVGIEQREAHAQKIAKRFFSKMDTNQDGQIVRSETSQSFRAFAWRTFDENADDELSWDEVLQQARLSLRL